ncbi:HAD family hydrolase [Clostridium pasteurianum]|uniref:HAD family hydrolase n=1 Tax=Clostridium pasteurianum TaxID=1501 RepID=UPI002260E194|nr:HAD family hydrolase [Clostridium pasteurianum]UZW13075.1 HAD family hydrolase [Clostridium pasteurianum]
MNIKGVLFDFNGTMFYDGEIQEISWRTYLQRKIGRKVTDTEFKEYVHGRNADSTFPYFLGRELSKKEIEELAEEKEVDYRELCLADKNKFKLANGLTEFLDYLKESKIPFTIATASGLNNVKFFFEHLDLAKWFDIYNVVYDDGTIPGKPEPEIYIRAANKIGIPINECMVFEDAKSGIMSAHRAGAYKIVGVASMLNKEAMLRIDGIDEVIEDYKNAINLLR